MHACNLERRTIDAAQEQKNALVSAIARFGTPKIGTLIPISFHVYLFIEVLSVSKPPIRFDLTGKESSQAALEPTNGERRCKAKRGVAHEDQVNHQKNVSALQASRMDVEEIIESDSEGDVDNLLM